MNATHYLVRGHTAKGYVNLCCSNLEPMNKVFLLIGGPGTGKLLLMRHIAAELQKKNILTEYLHNPLNPESLDGILFPGLGVGIVDGAAPSVIEPKAPGIVEEFINLSEAWDPTKLAPLRDNILSLMKYLKQSCEKAYEEFAKGLRVHDEWERIYIQNMNFERANQLSEEVIAMLLPAKSIGKSSIIKHRFFGGSTPYGPKDYVENITDKLTTRYFIKGRPGSGKSTMLKKLLESAKTQGIDVEVYHCGFDPDSLDMLLFPELSLCIFDSTSPHEYYPSREGDKVVDMYTELIKEGTDKLYAEELTNIVARYKSHTKRGTAHLAAALEYQKKLDQIYDDATDFEILDRIEKDVYQRIMTLH
jgi:hypothetical protein